MRILKIHKRIEVDKSIGNMRITSLHYSRPIEWCRENLDIDGMNSDFADITDYHTGGEQGGDDCKEWCDQTCKGEDWYEGDYYWETECKGKYLHMEFAI